MRFKALLHEPLLHFTLIGAALFGFFQIQNEGTTSPNPPIVISSGQIQQLAAQFNQTWQRPPNSGELKGLIDEALREEIAVREALSMGLEQDDTIIRRRLRQKLEFLLQDLVEAQAPSEEELQTWLTEHPDAFRVDPKLALRQVYFDPNLHGNELQQQLQTLQEKLQEQGASAPLLDLGDSRLLPQDVPLQSSFDIARTFGQDFAEQIEALPTGTWSAPIVSGYGVHLVLVQERIESSLPTLEQVRPQVEREFMAARHKQQQASLYENLLAKYQVIIEAPAEQPAPQSGNGS